jgi:hypothetical protein
MRVPSGDTRGIATNAHRARRQVQLREVVVVAVGAREHVAAPVGRQRSARAAQIAVHDLQRPRVDVVAIEARHLIGGVEIQRREIEPAPVG